MASVGLSVPASVIATSVEEARTALASGALQLPVVIRPAFTLGGHGGGFATTPQELDEAVTLGVARARSPRCCWSARWQAGANSSWR